MASRSLVNWPVFFQATGLGFLGFWVTLLFRKDVRGFTYFDLVFPLIVAAYIYIHNAILFKPSLLSDDGKARREMKKSPGLGPQSTLIYPRRGKKMSPVCVGQGTVVVVYAFRTSNEDSVRVFAPLLSTCKRFEPDGVSFVAIAKDPLSDVEEFLSDHRGKIAAPPSFRIASDEGGNVIERLYRGEDVAKTVVPHAFVVNGGGYVAWHGHPLQLEPALTRIVREANAAKTGVVSNGEKKD